MPGRSGSRLDLAQRAAGLRPQAGVCTNHKPRTKTVYEPEHEVAYAYACNHNINDNINDDDINNDDENETCVSMH